jgi:hypothetical protein
MSGSASVHAYRSIDITNCLPKPGMYSDHRKGVKNLLTPDESRKSLSESDTSDIQYAMYIPAEIRKKFTKPIVAGSLIVILAL